MGNKLRPLFKKTSRKINISEELNGKTVVVDGFLMIYQFLASYRNSETGQLLSYKGTVTSHLYGLFSRIIPFLKANIKVIFVLDGESPAEKNKVRTRRRERKEKQKKLLKYLKSLSVVSKTEIFSVSRSILEITPEIINTSKEFLSFLGIPVIQSSGEGEATCAYLQNKNLGDYVLSDDWDSVLFGASKIIRRLEVKNDIIFGEFFSIDQFLKEHNNEINIDNIIDAAILAGNDYFTGIDKIGPITAFKLVKKYKKLQTIFKSKEFEKFEKKVVNYSYIHRLFSDPVPPVEEIELVFNSIDFKGLESFLKDKGFKNNKIYSTLKELHNKKE